MHTTRTYLFLILAIGTAMMFISSCKEDAADTENPTISMQEPSPNDTISVGAGEVHIEFVTSDNDKLQSLSVTVTSPADSSLYSASPNVAGMKSYSFHQHITPVTSTVIPLTLIVTVTDASNNRATTTVQFYIKP